MPLLLLLLTGLHSADETGQSPLNGRLDSIARSHKGRVAIAVKHLGSGESYYLNADSVMPTASLIKLPILFEAYLQAVEGKIKLTETLTLRESDKVPGSGVLTENFSAGASFPLKDAVRLMTVYSDNTATNLVLDKIGIKSVNERMAAWGLKETRLNAKVFLRETTSIDLERSKKYGLGSTTAREMVSLLDQLMTTPRVKPSAKQAILGLLKRCDDRDKFSRLLPADVVLAHKTGTLANIRTDAGILFLDDGPIALCVLTADNEDRRWGRENAGDVLCSRVARAVYDHFNRKQP